MNYNQHYPNYMDPNTYNRAQYSNYQQMPYQCNQFQNIQQVPQFQNQQPNQPTFINGKLVDSVDILKVTEVPMGDFAVFPKADFSEIYVKSWTNNGTTQITTFKPVTETNAEVLDPNTKSISDIQLQLNNLEAKIDKIVQELGY